MNQARTAGGYDLAVVAVIGFGNSGKMLEA
jgi:hypothetical protein